MPRKALELLREVAANGGVCPCRREWADDDDEYVCEFYSTDVKECGPAFCPRLKEARDDR